MRSGSRPKALAFTARYRQPANLADAASCQPGARQRAQGSSRTPAAGQDPLQGPARRPRPGQQESRKLAEASFIRRGTAPPGGERDHQTPPGRPGRGPPGAQAPTSSSPGPFACVSEPAGSALSNQDTCRNARSPCERPACGSADAGRFRARRSDARLPPALGTGGSGRLAYPPICPGAS